MAKQTATADTPLPALRVGEHVTQGPNELYCLSPRPLPLGLAQVADVGRLVRRKDAATMDLMQGVSRNGMLAWGGAAGWMLIFIVFIFFFAMAVSFLAGDAFTWWEAFGIWGGAAYAALLFLVVTGLVYPDAILKGTPPVRFHRQRREVAFVVQHPGRRVWLPSPRNDILFGLWFALFTFSGGFAIIGFGFFVSPRFSLIMLICHVLILPSLFVGYSAFYHWCRRRAGWVRETVFVPWEDVVAVATRNVSFTLGGATGLGWHLTILPPDPARPGYSLAGAGISTSVGGLPGAMIQWELIRRYMEEGPEAVPQSADDYSVAWYRQYMAWEKERHTRKGKRFWWYRLKRWLELAYFASWYTEYRLEHVLPKAAPPGWLQEWSRSLPENQWASPSRELTQLSAQVRAAYERGDAFIALGPIEQRFGSASQQAPKASYRSVPFAAYTG
nr:hypothetical protein [uncultured Halomonas sp.]